MPHRGAAMLDRYRASGPKRRGGVLRGGDSHRGRQLLRGVRRGERCHRLRARRSSRLPLRRQQGMTTLPIHVGIGIHAGETVETTEGFVGSAVNTAARICAQAGPNEVLVSGTVRSLTGGVVEASFVPVGRRRLKGLTEPIQLFRVVGPDAPAARGAARPCLPDGRRDWAGCGRCRCAHRGSALDGRRPRAVLAARLNPRHRPPALPWRLSCPRSPAPRTRHFRSVMSGALSP